MNMSVDKNTPIKRGEKVIEIIKPPAEKFVESDLLAMVANDVKNFNPNTGLKSEVSIFENAEFGKVRVKMIDGEPWFVGKDVATALGYVNTEHAIQMHVQEDDKQLLKLVDIQVPPNEGGTELPPHMRGSQIILINEPGLYALVFRSELESAREFQRWVMKDVLPSIRKTGGYGQRSLGVGEVIVSPELLIGMGTTLKALREEIEILKPKALFADTVIASGDSILVAELAKLLTQKKFKMGQNRLFRWFRQNGYLGQKGEYYNLPTQKSMDLGLFEIKKSTINNPNGTSVTTTVTKVTPKGQIYFINKLN